MIAVLDGRKAEKQQKNSNIKSRICGKTYQGALGPKGQKKNKMENLRCSLREKKGKIPSVKLTFLRLEFERNAEFVCHYKISCRDEAEKLSFRVGNKEFFFCSGS